MAFRTQRLSVCRWCVTLLNRTSLSPREAPMRWREDFLERLRPGANTWPENWFASRLAESLHDPQRVRRSEPLRVMRAHAAGLVCVDREYLDYPRNWAFKRYKIKDEDGYSCALCGGREADGVTLHVHHIVHRSRSGTNAQRNLVTLCVGCHQEQHPGCVITAEGGEPRGMAIDDSVPDSADEILDDNESTDSSVSSAEHWTSPQHIAVAQIAAASPTPVSASLPIPAPPIAPAADTLTRDTRPHSFWPLVLVVIAGIGIVLLSAAVSRPSAERPTQSVPQQPVTSSTVPSHSPNPIEVDRLAIWDAAAEEWGRQHKDFLADPGHRAAMQSAIYDVDRETGHTLDATTILERAFARASSSKR